MGTNNRIRETERAETAEADNHELIAALVLRNAQLKQAEARTARLVSLMQEAIDNCEQLLWTNPYRC